MVDKILKFIFQAIDRPANRFEKPRRVRGLVHVPDIPASKLILENINLNFVFRIQNVKDIFGNERVFDMPEIPKTELPPPFSGFVSVVTVQPIMWKLLPLLSLLQRKLRASLVILSRIESGRFIT